MFVFQTVVRVLIIFLGWKKVSPYRDIPVFGIQNEMIYCISDISG